MPSLKQPTPLVVDQDHSEHDGSSASSSHDEKRAAAAGPLGNEEQGVDLQKQADEAAAHSGVSRIEALYLVFGKGWKIWLLYASIAIICYGYSLEQNTTYNYLAFATSSFGHHSLLGSISTATSIIASVSRPFIAKIADITSRPHAYLLALCVYVLGLVLLASSKNVNTVAAGQVLYTVGATGLDLVNTIIIGDISPLQYRGLFLSVASAPYIVNAFISGYITSGIGGAGAWRWGYGMFCIIMPALMCPALLVLFWGDYKAKKIGAVSLASSSYARREFLKKEEKKSWIQMAFYYFKIIDGLGLILLGFAWSLILLPFTLSAGANGGWHNASMIAMETVGWVIFIAFILYEMFLCPFPLMPRRILNRSFMCSVCIDWLYFFGGYIQLAYYSSWVYVVKYEWSFRDYTFFNNTLGVSLCVFGLLAGVLQRYFHHYKYIQVSGLCIRIIGMALTYYGTGSHATTGVLVMSNVLVGFGGSFSVVGSQVAAQASVPHADMATAIALLALWTNIGGSIGTAISAAIWTNEMPRNLEKRLNGVLNSTEIADIFGSITNARDSEPSVRSLVIQAYNDTVKSNMFLPGLIIAIVALIPGLLTSNYYLGSNQNAVEENNIIVLQDKDADEEALAKKAREVEEHEKELAARATQA
ncbi:MFS general substrate transporter [Meredithblackwellia eburnea MCA 4105]